MAHFEIEIKSLIGTAERADAFREKLALLSPLPILKGKHSQLNHYFTGGDVRSLLEGVGPYFSSEKQPDLKRILEEGQRHSVRTREADGKVLLVVKASIDDTSSSNGIARMEFEEAPEGLSLDALDALLLGSGFSYQAKWSRDREEYEMGDVAVCLDRNAGYGYLAEFEKVVETAEEADATKSELIALMRRVGVEELPQDRLERMFAFYNEHWPEYYGTDKVFTVE
jgi:adenylate cyclase class IV